MESDPRLQTLVEELRAVRDLVAAPVELPSDEVRDQMITQALDHSAPVVSLEKARRRRAVPSQARVILAAAAVVVALALVGVTLFNQAPRDEQDQFADDAATDAPTDSEEMPLPAPVAEPESAKAAEEPPPSPDSDDSAEVFMAEASAEEMMDEDMVIEIEEAPAEDSFASDDMVEPEPMMADRLETAPNSGEALSVFETSADLAAYAMQLAEEQHDPLGIERLEEAAAIDLLSCPLLPDEGLELLFRFDAVVDEVEIQASVYLTEGDLQLTETTPPPECELLNSQTFINWSE